MKNRTHELRADRENASKKRAVLGATTSKQRREIAKGTSRARSAKSKKSSQPQA